MKNLHIALLIVLGIILAGSIGGVTQMTAVSQYHHPILGNTLPADFVPAPKEIVASSTDLKDLVPLINHKKKLMLTLSYLDNMNNQELKEYAKDLNAEGLEEYLLNIMYATKIVVQWSSYSTINIGSKKVNVMYLVCQNEDGNGNSMFLATILHYPPPKRPLLFYLNSLGNNEPITSDETLQKKLKLVNTEFINIIESTHLKDNLLTIEEFKEAHSGNHSAATLPPP